VRGTSTERQSSNPPPSRRIGNYELVSELGAGTSGRVFLARRQGLERLFALKVLHKDLPPEQVERSQRGARLAAKLHHPNIVRPIDIGQAMGCIYVVMDHVPGNNLEDRLAKHGAMPWREAASLVAEVAGALAVAHEAGVVHRDLKPANVILHGRTGRAMVTDFGLARDTTAPSQLTQVGELIGSPVYMAPEQLEGGQVTSAADIYALGVMLYELVTGKLPYDASDLRSLRERVRSGRYKPVSEHVPQVNKELDQIVGELLSADPRARPSAQRVAEALRGFSGNASTTGGSKLLSYTASQLGVRPTVLLPVLGLWVLVLGGVTAWALWEHRGRRKLRDRQAELQRTSDEARAQSDSYRARLGSKERELEQTLEESSTLRLERDRLRGQVEAARQTEAELVRLRQQLREVNQQLADHRRKPPPQPKTGGDPAWEGLLKQTLARQIEWAIERLEGAAGPQAALTRATLLHNRGRYQETLAAIAAARAAQAQLGPELKALEARTLYKLGRMEEASRGFMDLAQAHPDTAPGLFGRALTSQDRAERVRLLQASAEADPKASYMRIALASGLVGADPKRALQLADEAIHNDPTAYQSYQLRSQIRLAEVQRTRDKSGLAPALRDARCAQLMNPGDPESWQLVAQILLAEGKAEEALAEATRGVAVADRLGVAGPRASARILQGQIALARRQTNLALQAWVQAVQLDPRAIQGIWPTLRRLPPRFQDPVIQALPPEMQREVRRQLGKR